MKSQKVSPAPDLAGLSDFQISHVQRTFPETRPQMADYLREGVEVKIGEQNEASGDVPPIAISVCSNPEFWIDCRSTVEEARQLVSDLGLVLVN